MPHNLLRICNNQEISAPPHYTTKEAKGVGENLTH